MTRYEQGFYEQFTRLQRDVATFVDIQKKLIELKEEENSILLALLQHLVHSQKAPAAEVAPKETTGNVQIDGALQKQRDALRKPGSGVT